MKSSMSREEYQEKVNKINIVNYKEEMKKIIDYNKLFDDPIDIVFDYNLEVQDIWE